MTMFDLKENITTVFLFLCVYAVCKKNVSRLFFVLFRINEFGYELQKSGCNNPMTCTKTKQTNGQ